MGLLNCKIPWVVMLFNKFVCEEEHHRDVNEMLSKVEWSVELIT